MAGSPTPNKSFSWRRHAPLVLAIALTFLLLALALLQRHWLAQVGAGERQRAHAHLQNAAASLSRDFNEPLSKLAFDFLPFAPLPRQDLPLPELLAGRLERWRGTAAEPDLLAGLWVVGREPGERQPRLSRLDEKGPALRSAAVAPPAFAGLLRRIAELPEGGGSWNGALPAWSQRQHRGAGLEILDESIPALVLPLPERLTDVFAPAPGAARAALPLPDGLPPWRAAAAASSGWWLVLELDPAVLVGRLLPQLAERHLGDPEFGLRVVAKDDPGRVIFESGRPVGQEAHLEVAADLFGPLVFSRNVRRALPFERPGTPVPEAPAVPPVAPAPRPVESPPAPAPVAIPPPPLAPTPPAPPPPPPATPWVAPAAPPAPPVPAAPVSATPASAAPALAAPVAAAPQPGTATAPVVFFSRTEGPPSAPFEVGEGRWRLEIYHQEGSLDAAIDRAQRRNLFLALGILAVLGAAMLFLAATARQAQELARRQMELVAGVTHELLTPLAAMKSAGQNLRDGVVQEAPKIARYGELIVKESDRLSGLVGQVLLWAGMAGHESALRRERVEPGRLAEEALEALRPALEAANFEVALETEENLPTLLGDPAALRQALGNLLANALKYGRPADGRPFLRLAVRRSADTVVFTVEDRGPGIAGDDLPHLFEPFYRGRRVVASNVAGAGLGLALVRRIAAAHGGEANVAGEPGRGAVFSLTLPLPEEAP